MCYSVYLATNSKQDLKCHNEDQIYFEKIEKKEKITSLLKHENKWYVGSSSGCSCAFRHLMSYDLGFGEPEDWYPEEKEDLEATKKLYNIISKLVTDGYKVECLDAWEGVKPEEIKTMDVEIDNISEREFRLFENYLFRFKKNKGLKSKN